VNHRSILDYGVLGLKLCYPKNFFTRLNCIVSDVEFLNRRVEISVIFRDFMYVNWSQMPLNFQLFFIIFHYNTFFITVG